MYPQISITSSYLYPVEKFPLTFARFPVKSTSWRGSLLAAIELSLWGSPCQRLCSREHHYIGGRGCATRSPESGATGIGWLQHPRCRTSERKHDVRPLVLLLRLYTSFSLLILSEDRLSSFSFRLAYRPFSLPDLVSSKINIKWIFLQKADFELEVLKVRRATCKNEKVRLRVHVIGCYSFFRRDGKAILPRVNFMQVSW